MRSGGHSAHARTLHACAVVELRKARTRKARVIRSWFPVRTCHRFPHKCRQYPVALFSQHLGFLTKRIDKPTKTHHDSSKSSDQLRYATLHLLIIWLWNRISSAVWKPFSTDRLFCRPLHWLHMLSDCLIPLLVNWNLFWLAGINKFRLDLW